MRIFLLVALGIVVVASIMIITSFSAGAPTVSKKVAVTIGSHSFDSEVADTMTARSRGLSGRPNLPENAAILFVFNAPGVYPFWMKDMQFPIDIVWIRSGKIVGFQENMQPEPGKSDLNLKLYFPPRFVDRVLEMNAGMAQKYDFKIGDSVSVAFGK